MNERASKFRIFERRKIETGPDQRVWRPSVNEAITSGHDAVVRNIDFINIVAKNGSRTKKKRKQKLFIDTTVEFEDILFFLKKGGNNTPVRIVESILQNVQPRIEERENNNIDNTNKIIKV